MRLTILLEEDKRQLSNSKGQGFRIKLDLMTKSGKSIDILHGILFEKELTSKNIANLLYVKYGELFHQGINVSVLDNGCRLNHRMKNALLLLKKEFPNNNLVMTKHRSLKYSEQSSIKLQKILTQAEKLKNTEEAVYVQPIRLKKEKKLGFAVTHYKNGHIVSQSSELFNRGVMVSIEDKIDKINKMTQGASEKAQVYLCCEDESKVLNLNDIKKNFKKKFIKPLQIENNPLFNKSFKESIARIKYKEYLTKLNEELLNKDNVVVFTDGGRKDFVGMSSYIIVDNNKIHSKSILSGKQESSSNESIAMLSAMKFAITNPDLNKRKIHFVCDSDELYDVYKSLTENNIKTKNQVKGLPLYKEMRSLLKEHNHKIYFHFVKSHQSVHDFMTYGNDLVDTLNIQRLRKAADRVDPVEISEKYKTESKTFHEYVGGLEIDFYAGLTKTGKIKENKESSSIRKIETENPKPKKRINGNKIKRN